MRLFSNNIEEGRLASPPRSRPSDGAATRLHASRFDRLSQGHRGYIDNPRLISTQARKPPVPRGHRRFLEIA
jgi:hypothetical protein